MQNCCGADDGAFGGIYCITLPSMAEGWVEAVDFVIFAVMLPKALSAVYIAGGVRAVWGIIGTGWIK